MKLLLNGKVKIGVLALFTLFFTLFSLVPNEKKTTVSLEIIDWKGSENDSPKKPGWLVSLLESGNDRKARKFFGVEKDAVFVFGVGEDESFDVARTLAKTDATRNIREKLSLNSGTESGGETLNGMLLAGDFWWLVKKNDEECYRVFLFYSLVE